MTSFTSSLVADIMYLFVPQPTTSVDLWDQISKPFAPLTPGVWLTIGIIIIVTGTLQVCLTQRLWWPEWSEKVQWDVASRRRKALLLFNRLTEGWYETYMGVVTGGIEMDESHRLGTRFLNMGLGIFVVVFLSAYTANLAAFLGSAPKSNFWNGLDDATDAGAKVCAHVALQGKLGRLYPNTNWHFRYMDTDADVREGLEVDKCDAFVVSMRAMRTGKAMDAVRCEKKFVLSGTAVDELEVALPASPDVADAISYWMKAAANNGTSYQSVQARHQYPPQCPLMVDGSQIDELRPLDMSNFLAPTLVLVFFMALAISTRAFRVSGQRLQTMRRESIDKNENILQTLRRAGTGRDLLAAVSTADGRAVEGSEEDKGSEAKDETNGTAPSQMNGKSSVRSSAGEYSDDYTSGVYTQAKGEDLRSFTTAGLHRHNAKKLLDMEKVLGQITRKLEVLQPPARPDMCQLEA